MDFHKKRESWTESETRQMLLIIKKNYISKLVHNASYRNLKIFEEISTEMAKLNYKKNALQIRIKFKSLKQDYKKLIQNASNYSDYVRRHTKQHFDLLKEIFEGSASKTDESATTVKAEMEAETGTSDPLQVTYYVSELKSELDEESEDELTEEILPEIDLNIEDDTSAPNESMTTSLKSIEINTEQRKDNKAGAPFKTFKQQKRQSYHNVVENFTKEWKESQHTLMQTMEQQDEKYLRAIELQCKRQEAMLREDRQEMERILKQDREEMKSFFGSILQAMGVSKANGPTNLNNI